jgi:diguanylate cyclase (GGDEF)-like protein
MKEDILTGFYVREELIPYLNKLINTRTPFTVGLIDLNGFKKYNDKYGHAFGDEILKYVASTLKLTIGGAGRIFRLGGDEFLVVFPNRNKRSAINIFRFCNRNLQRRPFLSGNRLYKITASYGLAAYPQDAQDSKQLISLADKAMYFSKKKRSPGSITDVSKISILKLGIFLKRLIFLIILVVGIYLVYQQRTPIIKFFTEFSSLYSPSRQSKRVIKTTGEPGLYLKKENKYLSSQKGSPVFVKLRNGFVIEGNLVEEDADSLTLEVEIRGVRGKVSIDKNLVLEVR